MQVQTNKKDPVTVVDFNNASGVMTPLVTCKGHPQHRRQTFGICEMNESNEVCGITARVFLCPDNDRSSIDGYADILQELQANRAWKHPRFAPQGAATR